MALIDVYHAAVADSQVRQRVIGAALIAAGDIRVEDVGTDNHANRLVWADALSDEPTGVGTRLFHYMLRDATILGVISDGTPITDAQVQAAINDYIDAVATGE